MSNSSTFDYDDYFLNITSGELQLPLFNSYPLSYRIIATVLHVAIFVCGVTGNALVIVVVTSVKRTVPRPVSCYLVSMAVSDLITLFSAVPEAIMSHHLGMRWVLGQFGCSLLVFGNFLGINSHSLSLLAFTVERYIAVLHPFFAQKVCTAQRAKRILGAVWLVAVVYCAPWLSLTLVRTDPDDTTIELCDLRLSSDQYLFFFLTDLIVFYSIPLLVACFVHWRIAVELKPNHSRHGSLALTISSSKRGPAQRAISVDSSQTRNTASHSHALRMLFALVGVYALCWLPYRGVLVYNTVASEAFLDVWYMLFAKTLIYANCAINPFLFGFVNKEFRQNAKLILLRRRSTIVVL